ncbi:MAG: TolC family protein [Spirosomataceae bacterium]
MKYLLSVVFISVISVLGFAQKPSISNELSVILPPLEELIASAQQHSPQVRMQEALIQKNEQAVDVQRKQWLDGIGVDLQLGTGNQAMLIQQATGSVESFNNLNNGYRAAVNIRLSVFDVAGRKNWIKMAHYEKQVAVEKQAVAEEELGTFIITKYYAVQSAQNLLRIKSEAKQATQLNRQMAEKEFNEGSIPLAEVSRIIEISSKAASEYEVAKQYLYENLRVLENITGRKLY